MRHIVIVLLLIAVLLVTIETTSANQNDLGAKRTLRTRDENDEEERAISTSTVSTVAGKATTWTFRYGDEALLKTLDAVKKTSRTSDIANKLQMTPTSQKSVSNMFELLKLDQGVDKLLTSPNLKAFVTYMNKFNQKNPGKETTLITTMTINYGDDVLAKALEAAKHVPSTSKMATDLQAAQFAMWLRGGAKPSQIWKMLNMKKASWLTNPDAQVWWGYNKFFNLHK